MSTPARTTAPRIHIGAVSSAEIAGKIFSL
jgi:hypothetical protein